MKKNGTAFDKFIKGQKLVSFNYVLNVQAIQKETCTIDNLGEGFLSVFENGYQMFITSSIKMFDDESYCDAYIIDSNNRIVKEYEY